MVLDDERLLSIDEENELLDSEAFHDRVEIVDSMVRDCRNQKRHFKRC